MVNIALGIILALVILIVAFVVIVFIWNVGKAVGEEVSDEDFGQKVLNAIIFVIKSPITYFKYLAPILVLCFAMWVASHFNSTATLITYIVGIVAVVFYFVYLKEQRKAKKLLEK